MPRSAGFLLVLSLCCLQQLRARSEPAQDQPFVLEALLATQPANDQVRSALMDAYVKASDSTGYMQQVFWLIENKPQSQILNTRGKLKPAGGTLNSVDDYRRAGTEWEEALVKHPKSAPVLYNAAIFLTPEDPARAVDILERARELAPGQHDYAGAEGVAFLMAFVRDESGNPKPPLTLENADALKARLLGSSNPELLSGVGRVLATEGRDPEIKKAGLDLMKRATFRDQSNPKWQESLEEVQSPDASARLRSDAVRITAEEAEANLIARVEPAYPTLAKSGRIQGVVQFTALIDGEGKVQHLDLTSGPPLLVDAAKDAILQWNYKPVVVNDRPVPVITDVSVTFNLSQ